MALRSPSRSRTQHEIAGVERPLRLVGARRLRTPSASLQRFEGALAVLCDHARILPAITAGNGAGERMRLATVLQRGGLPVPRFELPARRPCREALRALDASRQQARGLPGEALYLAKLDELELDLLLLDVLGTARLVRPLSARRYATGATLAPTALGPLPLSRCARMILDRIEPCAEARVLPAEGTGQSVASFVQYLAGSMGLRAEVQIEARLAAGAATGEHTVYLADRRFGRREARRLAVHEVLGHLVSAANARMQPLGLLRLGTAGSFVDQEGLALHMEEAFGLLDGVRLRTLAGRVLATDMLHGGASFAETARTLYRRERFTASEAIGIAERAYRGGGVARDAGYLLGWLRLHEALRTGSAQLDALRMGRVSLDALRELRALQSEGYACEPRFLPALPNLVRSLCSTSAGTTPLRSPPSDAASLIRLELTKK